MSAAPPPPPAPPAEAYRRFPGTGNHLFNRVRCSLGSDHLLQVTATGYSEVYRRFFFRDIQVISLHKTVSGTIWNLVLGGFLFLFVSLAVSFGLGSLIGFGPIIILVGVPLGINIARGPTCACYIQTAVQLQRMYSLNRVRRARRLIERLKPLVASAQPPAPPAEASPAPSAPLEQPAVEAAEATPPDSPGPV